MHPTNVKYHLINFNVEIRTSLHSLCIQPFACSRSVFIYSLGVGFFFPRVCYSIREKSHFDLMAFCMTIPLVPSESVL